MFLWSAYTAVQFCTYEQLRSTDFLRSQAASSNNSSRRSERYTSGVGRTGEGGGRDGGEGIGVRGARGRGAEEGVGRGLPPALSNFVYGSIAAFTATLLTYPLDITRTALAFQVREQSLRKELREYRQSWWLGEAHLCRTTCFLWSHGG